ncbi:zincin-like metallopeptidase domain-containing protein [Sphingomonas sp. BIUV-7]|uniref:Zincin-like metallopeptidase domain-containing protein n=1 Tax=Sphingomonas natans TaxID=3063330 RepID=A0ABT8Y7R1_9SPHN|nr:zincin-like metallopeptidase domain-containing protein [Sphingomonas sp. BIUV-7]MDO6414351.1 zincin-like metallopeptidase domain-containing protein [Sphingomonas sp. BIUV-7]
MGQDRSSLQGEVTQRIIAELEQGRQPWVQPWDDAKATVGLPRNAHTGRCYSGINILILWARVVEQGFAAQRWLTFHQARSLGGNVRRGEQGSTVCYADRFIPKAESDKALIEGREARTIAFLKRFTVFNVAQCDGLPAHLVVDDVAPQGQELVPIAHRVAEATGAKIRIGGKQAFYAPLTDHIQLPPQFAYGVPINWYRTLLHELGHWTGHSSRLNRLADPFLDKAEYAREELCAELASSFLCAELGIVPTVRHADYIGAWLEILREDDRAIFRAASHASRAVDYILNCGSDREEADLAAR